MEDPSQLDQLSIKLDENDELNAITLTTLLNSGVEEALSSLSPAQLIQLEKNVQKLKKQKTPSGTPIRRRSEVTGHGSEKRRKLSVDSNGEIKTPRSTGGQYMNLPASAPHIEIRDGIEWLYFTYSTKGHVQEYCIRIDVDDLSINDIPDDFKAENCVYPRALATREAYTGNRYDYETSVNELAWKLTWLNSESLGSKRGLIQRAVDSFRNRAPESRSRRVLRQQKLQEGNLRRRSTLDSPIESIENRISHPPRTITLQYTAKSGDVTKLKLRIDIENVDLNEIDEDFRRSNCLYPQALEGDSNFSDSRYEYETSCNEIAWKLAWLNNPKLSNQPTLLQKAVDAFRAKYDSSSNNNISGHHSSNANMNNEKEHDFSEMVAQTLQQVLGQDEEDMQSQVSLEDHLAAQSGVYNDESGFEDAPDSISTRDL